ncbi:autophagy protein Apg17-domain-containing protein [Lanmaoa asiatica]|nr:autophagy protein Apg17-domain-containing protein [Lanmaoa asiatica]
MTSPPPTYRADQPHLVSLVLQSKKALQHGEQLCSKANALTNVSAQCAVDVLALDAKVKWISEAVIEQLKLAASVAKSIEHKRTQLDKQIREWDAVRLARTSALDTILESIGAQLVPSGFHQTSTDSSLFGSQHSLDKVNGIIDPTQSPSATVRGNVFEKKLVTKHVDRSTWKTLRDFIDESAIEQVLDAVESDRTRLDDVISTTYDYPETLSTTVSSIRDSLPVSNAPPPIESLLVSQEKTTTGMARHLESLASHYDQMANALHDSEAGISHSEEEMQGRHSRIMVLGHHNTNFVAMHRDTDELPAIMAELEEDVHSIQEAHEKLVLAKIAAQGQIDASRSTLDDLDELGDIMSDMLQKQQDVEANCEDLLEGLQQRLLVVEDLHHRFIQYQSSFFKLLIEIARRQQYRENAEKIVESMMVQLGDMSSSEQARSLWMLGAFPDPPPRRHTEERQIREDFNAEHGAHIPTDICLCIENSPTRWEVVPWAGDTREVLPEIDADLLTQGEVGGWGGGGYAWES